MTIRIVADQYFDAVRARDIHSWIALFAEDASYSLPENRIFNETEAIREFQLSVFPSGSPSPGPTAYVLFDNSIAVEIEATLPDGTVRNTANFFHLDESGKIQRLSVFRKV